MILRIDDTHVERNTEQSLQLIFDGLNWLHLSWDEQQPVGPSAFHLFVAIGRDRAIARLKAV